jgi:hypothetical protein
MERADMPREAPSSVPVAELLRRYRDAATRVRNVRPGSADAMRATDDLGRAQKDMRALLESRRDRRR